MIEVSTNYLGHVVIEKIDDNNNAYELATLYPKTVEALKNYWGVED